MHLLRHRVYPLALLAAFVLVAAGCGSAASPENASSGPVDPSVQVALEATSEPVETSAETATALEAATDPAPEEQSEDPPATEPPSEPKLTLDPLTVTPGEGLCTVQGVNYLDRLEISLEFIGTEPLSAVSFDYRLNIEGETTKDVGSVGLLREGEQVRVLRNTSTIVPADIAVEEISCEVLTVNQFPMSDELAGSASCEVGELDEQDRLAVTVTADTSTATSLADGLSLSDFHLALYDSNGVRVFVSIPKVVLPTDGSEVQLHRRTWVPVGSPIDLAAYELSCAAFAFGPVETLVSAAPGSTCTFDGIDGFLDLTGFVDSPLDGSVDMWLAAVDPDGTWVGTTRAYVFPGTMDFATTVPVPDGLSASDLSCHIVGIEQ